MNEPEIFYWRGTWVHANQLPLMDGRKTDTWEIVSTGGRDILGHVKWFGRWRRFAFWPEPETVFDEVCMRELSDFCEKVTQMRAEARKKY